jgi:antitoxin component of MazEF toxin-antitoxin module
MNDYDDDAAAARFEDAENLRPVGRGERPKRPARKLGNGVPVRFPEALVMEIKRLADSDGVTVSAWIRSIVTREVERRRPRPTTANRSTRVVVQFGDLSQLTTTRAIQPEHPFAGPLVSAQ